MSRRGSLLSVNSAGSQNKIDTGIFRDYIKLKFKSMIMAIERENAEQKLLIMDRSFLDIFRLLFTKDEIGVGKITFINEDLISDAKHLIFLTPPSVQTMAAISIVVRANLNKNYHIIFSPRMTFACKEALQCHKVYGSFGHIFDFNFDLIPLDHDLLSLEISNAARLLYCDFDTYIILLIAESINRLELIFGRIKNVFSKGYSVKTIAKMVQLIEDESKIKVDEVQQSEIDCLVVLDRNLDFATPMLTQFTYAGVMDDLFGIKQNSIVNLDKKFFPVSSAQGPKDQEVITCNLAKDKVFKEIKDHHIQAVPGILDEKLEDIKALNDEIKAAPTARDNLKAQVQILQKERKMMDKDLDKVATHVEVRNYIDTVREHPMQHKLLRFEQAIVDSDIKPAEVTDYVQTLIGRGANITQVLRLLCLLCQTQNGIKSSVLTTIKRDIIMSYGFEQAFTLNYLEKADILFQDRDPKVWENLTNQLNLINSDPQDPRYPHDASFAYSGFTSVLVRLVEALFKKDGWTGINSSLQLLPGPLSYDDRASNLLSDQSVRNTVLVYIIGGVTYGELAAFRFLGKKYNKEIIVLTTSIINGEKLISSFTERN